MPLRGRPGSKPWTQREERRAIVSGAMALVAAVCFSAVVLQGGPHFQVLPAAGFALSSGLLLGEVTGRRRSERQMRDRM